ncbi:MAG: GNAT family N-acetyltransferase [Armatimonadetes bacterium]|nr:GNAT family N-acetyltransferase [Armatimonadota bacterium]MCX7968799.1 GNAT family N-acetyltransferase [Armatimonadota bacterium]MDW8143684.1 GNAT family N-acetyltransferase [Armatimonadota bacterium]
MLTMLDLELGVWVNLRSGERVLIRRFRRTDGEALYEFFTKGLSPESQRLYSVQPLDRSLVNAVVSEADAPDVLRLVAFCGDKIVGYAYWRQQLFNPKMPLLSIAVADGHQGLGLGQALMELLIEGAKLKGMEGIELHVFKHNRRAIALYRKLGFEIVGDTDNGRQWIMVLLFNRNER